MFCCTRKQTHKGEIVTALCLQSQCSQYRNQLSCTLCLQEDHRGHQITSLSKVVPQLLEVQREKGEFKRSLIRLLDFVSRQFGEQNEEGEATSLNNIVQRTEALLLSLKQQVELNTQEMSKMKSIFKNINKNNQQSFYKNSKNQESYFLQTQSPQKFNNNPSIVKSKIVGNQSQMSGPQIDCFSHSAKHPYLTISPNLRTVVKTSHSGHRFAAIGAKNLSEKQHQLRICVDKSISGNIMIGLCHESVVKQKQYCNSYGIGTGTYLIGQNGNNPGTAISFHHSIAVMNRKQVVGWNFEEGDVVVIGVKFTDHYIYFRRQGKKSSQEFSMKISAAEPKTELKTLLSEGFKFIVLLQSQGDQVSIIEQ